MHVYILSAHPTGVYFWSRVASSQCHPHSDANARSYRTDASPTYNSHRAGIPHWRHIGVSVLHPGLQPMCSLGCCVPLNMPSLCMSLQNACILSGSLQVFSTPSNLLIWILISINCALSSSVMSIVGETMKKKYKNIYLQKSAKK